MRLLITVVAAALLSGCAARQQTHFANRFVKPGEPTTTFDDPSASLPQQSLSDYWARLRSLQATPRTKATLLPTIESTNRELASALTALAFFDSAENHRLAAAAYQNAGVLDYAYRHFQRALKLEPCDSASYEGVARLWRTWKRPELALGDAYRAIHCQPKSASAYNTLGTVFLSLGQRTNAREAFTTALRLDDRAAFALNNLCYLSVLEGDGAGAQQTCERALTLDPAMPTARTNLALAYALQGDLSHAEQRLLSAPNLGTAHYNIGILRMSLGKYADAADAFELALQFQPNLSDAARRAIQARAFGAAQKEH